MGKDKMLSFYDVNRNLSHIFEIFLNGLQHFQAGNSSLQSLKRDYNAAFPTHWKSCEFEH